MATEKRLIDPDEFLRWLVKRFKCVPLVGSCDRDSESMKLLLAQAPTVDAVEVVHGHWELHGNDDDCGCSYFCSNCHNSFDEDWFYVHGHCRHWNYCPHCGARMDGDENA